VVVDHLDVVAVGVEHERALVARVVLRPLPGPPLSRYPAPTAAAWKSATAPAYGAGNAMWMLRAAGRSSRSTENDPLSALNWTRSSVVRPRTNPAYGPIRS
jgi:hypothetical protein